MTMPPPLRLLQAALATACFCCATCWLPLDARAQKPPPAVTIPPMDQTAADASFQAFKARLFEALQARDMAFMEQLVVENHPTGFGLTPILDFFQGDPCGEDHWKDLERALRLGCVEESAENFLPATPEDAIRPEKVFLCPYLIAGNYPDAVDMFEIMVTVSPEASLRSEPAETSPELARLRHEVVQYQQTIYAEAAPGAPEGCAPPAWHKVLTAGGKTGYVNASQAMSPLDCRYVFLKTPGRGVDGWVLQDVYCGD